MKDLGHRPNALLLFSLVFQVVECSIHCWEMLCMFKRCWISLHHLHSLHLTFPLLSHTPFLSNIHMTSTVASLKVPQTVILVSETPLEVLLKKLREQYIASWFGWWKNIVRKPVSQTLLCGNKTCRPERIDKSSHAAITCVQIWDFWLPALRYLNLHQLELYCTPDDHVWWSGCVSRSPCKNTTSAFAKKPGELLSLFSPQFYPAKR